jgi:hypothetical protein
MKKQPLSTDQQQRIEKLSEKLQRLSNIVSSCSLIIEDNTPYGDMEEHLKQEIRRYQSFLPYCQELSLKGLASRDIQLLLDAELMDYKTLQT